MAKRKITPLPFKFRINDSGVIYTNEGATAEDTHTLPPAQGNMQLSFVVQDSDGLKITAYTGDTIRLGSSVSTTGGYIRSSVVGSAVTLVAVNYTEWVAKSIVGTWQVDI